MKKTEPLVVRKQSSNKKRPAVSHESDNLNVNKRSIKWK
jgi:hypothetical protein